MVPWHRERKAGRGLEGNGHAPLPVGWQPCAPPGNSWPWQPRERAGKLVAGLAQELPVGDEGASTQLQVLSLGLGRSLPGLRGLCVPLAVPAALPCGR